MEHIPVTVVLPVARNLLHLVVVAESHNSRLLERRRHPPLLFQAEVINSTSTQTVHVGVQEGRVEEGRYLKIDKYGLKMVPRQQYLKDRCLNLISTLTETRRD